MSVNVVTLAEIVVEGGLQTGPFGSQLKANEYAEAGIPVVMPKDIDGGKITTHSVAYTTSEKSRQLTKHLIKPGDILFPRRGDLGRIAVAQESNEGWICGTGCLRARLAQNALPDFIHQYLQLDYVVKWLKSNALGQTMLNLNTEIIGALPIYLPSYQEQKSIAKALQTWDAAIEKTEALIDAKERQFRWLVQHMIGRYQLGDGWSGFTLEDIFKVSVHKSKSAYICEGGKYYIVDMGSISRHGELIATKRANIAADLLEVGELVMPKDDIGGGNIIGKVAVVDKRDKYVCGDHVYRLRAKCTVNPIFIKYVINSTPINKMLRAKANGTSQLGLGKKDVLSQVIRLPSISTQQDAANTLDTAQQEIYLLKKLVDQYRTQKRGLMQELING